MLKRRGFRFSSLDICPELKSSKQEFICGCWSSLFSLFFYRNQTGSLFPLICLTPGNRYIITALSKTIWMIKIEPSRQENYEYSVPPNIVILSHTVIKRVIYLSSDAGQIYKKASAFRFVARVLICLE